MQRTIVAYVVMLSLFPAFDFLWIGVIARRLYQGEIGLLSAPRPRIAAAIAFYVIYAAGVLGFALAPNWSNSWTRAMLAAAAFGLVAYATYDLTNLATLSAFTPKLALADMAWGTAMTLGVAALARFAALKLG
jgi:uncharacterized membrane protein